MGLGSDGSPAPAGMDTAASTIRLPCFSVIIMWSSSMPSAKAFSKPTWDTYFAGEPEDEFESLGAGAPDRVQLEPAARGPACDGATVGKQHSQGVCTDGTDFTAGLHALSASHSSALALSTPPSRGLTLSHTWQVRATTPHKTHHAHAPLRNSQTTSNEPQDNHMLQAKRRTPSHPC